MVVSVLLMRGFVEVKDSVLGWKIKENINHDVIMIKSHGLGFSWGISLRRGRSLFV